MDTHDKVILGLIVLLVGLSLACDIYMAKHNIQPTATCVTTIGFVGTRMMPMTTCIPIPTSGENR